MNKQPILTDSSSYSTFSSSSSTSDDIVTMETSRRGSSKKPRKVAHDEESRTESKAGHTKIHHTTKITTPAGLSSEEEEEAVLQNIETSAQNLESLIQQGTLDPAAHILIQSILADKERLIAHNYSIREQHAEELAQLEVKLKKKGKKVHQLDRENTRLQAFKDMNAELSVDETSAIDKLEKKYKKLKTKKKNEISSLNAKHLKTLKLYQKEISNLTIENQKYRKWTERLMSMKAYLMVNIEWIKNTVPDSFPKYNGFFFSLLFSDALQLFTNALLDTLTQTSDSSSECNCKDSTSETSEAPEDSAYYDLFWLTYLAAALGAFVGWFLDRYVSKHSSITTKLNNIDDALAGRIQERDMTLAVRRESVVSTAREELEPTTIQDAYDNRIYA